MRVFLSYSDEDWRIAGMVTERLDRQGNEVFNWRNPKLRGQRVREKIEEAINQVDFFLALLSPSSLGSEWCKREMNLALRREEALRRQDRGASFIIVAKVMPVEPLEAGTVADYDWLDMTSPEQTEESLRILAVMLASPAQVMPDISPNGQIEGEPAPEQGGDEPVFRNRVDELRKVLLGLTTAGGPHFWLVVAPPQLGKTWFLRQISTDASLSRPLPWVINRVDLRTLSPDVYSDPAALLERLFEHSPQTADEERLFSIAQAIISAERPHLCLLDSAELLTEATARSLRNALSEVYHLVQDAGIAGLRFAFIVASRRDDEWKGVTPAPRLAALPLTEFHTDVVEQALHDLAQEMNREIPVRLIRSHAARAHRLTEGLPALLVRCLQWIRTKKWVAMEDRLQDPRRFAELADPYIEQELLTPASLLPASWDESGAALQALVEAYRVLVPYRLFTQSHLRYHLESDDEFRDALIGAGWAMQDLWEAIGATALLKRPLNEPWQEIHAAIRRLLYRYFYKTADERELAHNEAREFVELWGDGQVGTEQVVGLVECLWHEAVAVGPAKPAEMERRLTESARKLSGCLRESSAFTLPELRAFVIERMRNDEEFQEAIGGVAGMFDRLAEIVTRPGES